MRVAFYYGWYPEQWAAAGHRWTSTQGEYDSGDPAVIDNHIGAMKYARIEAGIYSWWGRGSQTDNRFGLALDRAEAGGFKFAIYHEIDQDGQRPKSYVEADIRYLKETYFNHPAYLRIDNKPVIFVYAPGGPLSMVDKWSAVRNRHGLYVSITDLPRWWTKERAIDHWHGYKPDERYRKIEVNGVVYSVSISAGFWNDANNPDMPPRLERDFGAWENAVAQLAIDKPRIEAVYWNEFGEGTNIEPSNARCEADAYCGDYLHPLAAS